MVLFHFQNTTQKQYTLAESPDQGTTTTTDTVQVQAFTSEEEPIVIGARDLDRAVLRTGMFIWKIQVLIKQN